MHKDSKCLKTGLVINSSTQISSVSNPAVMVEIFSALLFNDERSRVRNHLALKLYFQFLRSSASNIASRYVGSIPLGDHCVKSNSINWHMVIHSHGYISSHMNTA